MLAFARSKHSSARGTKSLRGQSFRTTSHGITLPLSLRALFLRNKDVGLHRYKPDFFSGIAPRAGYPVTRQGISLIVKFRQCTISSSILDARRVVSTGSITTSLGILRLRGFPPIQPCYFLGPILHYCKTKQLFIFDGTQTVIVLVLPCSSFDKRGTLGRFAYVNLRAKQ